MKKIVLALVMLSLIAAGCDATVPDQSNIESSNGQQSSIIPPQTEPPQTPEPIPTPIPSTDQVPALTPPPKTETPRPTPKPVSSCDPNYSGCVPIASDVDCAGGSGNGPAYVNGPITVIGSDIYDLDRDHDGIACE